MKGGRIDFNKIVFLIPFIFVVLLAIFGFRIMKERDGNIEKIEALEEELRRLKAGREEIETGLDKISDEEYLERVLREDFLMVRPGEKRVIILDEREEEQKEEPEEEGGFFDFLPF